MDGFSHIVLLYVFHRSDDYTLRVTAFLDDQERGLFATRYPARPNPIGLSIVRLLSIHDHLLEIEDVDMLDGTPVLEIKPYVPDFDVRTDVRTGWYAARNERDPSRCCGANDPGHGRRICSLPCTIKRGIT